MLFTFYYEETSAKLVDTDQIVLVYTSNWYTITIKSRISLCLNVLMDYLKLKVIQKNIYLWKNILANTYQ
jgi:hypothetical protein